MTVDIICEQHHVVTACYKNKENVSDFPLWLRPLLFVSFSLACCVTMAVDSVE
jgi:hypothetical protein